MTGVLSADVVGAFLQVIMIDVVLSGDNAIAIGLAAAGLAPRQRTRAILIGIIAAAVLRIAFALIATQLLQVVGLILAGGILLLWVCWKMWREMRTSHSEEVQAEEALTNRDIDRDGRIAGKAPRKTFAQAAWQIIVADISMSLDNVLAVAGAAREHPMVLAFGLTLSILLMALAASLIARILDRYRWIGYAGLAVVFYVAASMIFLGAAEVVPLIAE